MKKVCVGTEFDDNFRIVDTYYGLLVININDKFIGETFLHRDSRERRYYWSERDIIIISKLIECKCRNNNEIIFYDVGANIGTHTLALSNIFKNRIKIRAFEAQSVIYKMLCKTIELNNLTNIKTHLAAVSDENGSKISINLPDYSKKNNFGGLELKSTSKVYSDNHDMVRSGLIEDISTIKLDNFKEPVDFMKLDIEGMENLAVRGAKNLLIKHRPFVFMELFKTDIHEVIAFFKSQHYNVFMFLGANTVFQNIDAFFIPAESMNCTKGMFEKFTRRLV